MKEVYWGHTKNGMLSFYGGDVNARVKDGFGLCDKICFKLYPMADIVYVQVYDVENREYKKQ